MRGMRCGKGDAGDEMRGWESWDARDEVQRMRYAEHTKYGMH